VKKLIVFADGQFKDLLNKEIEDNKLPFLKEIVKNRIELTYGTRYSFEVLYYTNNVQLQINRLGSTMKLLNWLDMSNSTLKEIK
jgi:hypothetical protein